MHGNMNINLIRYDLRNAHFPMYHFCHLICYFFFIVDASCKAKSSVSTNNALEPRQIFLDCIEFYLTNRK